MKISRLISRIAAIALGAFADTALANAGLGSRTAEDWKVILQAPAALFVLMCLASVTQALGAIVVAKRQGSSMTFGSYVTYWPETVSTLLLNMIGFAVLIMTDQLNFASALGIGFGVSNVVDLIMPKGTSRAGAVAATTQGTPNAIR